MSDIIKNVQPVGCCYSQKVLPLAFDESMSYLEQICRIKAKLNELISLFNTELEDQLELYINEKFNDMMIKAMYTPATETLTLYLDNGD